MQFNVLFVFRNNWQSGMTNLLRKNIFSQVTGLSFFIPDLNCLKVSSLLIGWDLMKQKLFFYNAEIRIRTLDEDHISFVVNGHRIRLYHNPQTKEQFLHDILQQSEIKVVNRESSPFSQPT